MPNSFNIVIARSTDKDGREGYDRLVSFLEPSDLSGSGLPPFAVVGSLGRSTEITDQSVDLSPEAFVANPLFVHFMHGVIEKAGREDQEVKQRARTLRKGSVLLIDGRTPDGDQGNVSSEDVIGGFDVKWGKVRSYQGNPTHRLYTENGIVQLLRPCTLL